MNNLQDHPHRRFNQLTGEWVLVSPHRTKRPWQGQQEPPQKDLLPEYDDTCYLCPGNKRAEGEINPDYSGTFVFTNDFAALLPEAADIAPASDTSLLVAEPESGICKVLCYSPRHDLSMARMSAQQMAPVVELWKTEFADLAAKPNISYVQIFENRGLMMGCSNPHPHGQIWATSTVPDIPAREDCRQGAYYKEHGDCMLCTYLEQERRSNERIIFANDSFTAMVPYWAVWPFETLILPHRHGGDIRDLTEQESFDLADALTRLAVRYDNLFQAGFPYSMGLHQQPVSNASPNEHWHWHIHFFPPLLRSSTVRKFMVGFEMMAMPQRDLTAESAATRLREQSETHYLHQGARK